jgi:hypothetical protein
MACQFIPFPEFWDSFQKFTGCRVDEQKKKRKMEMMFLAVVSFPRKWLGKYIVTKEDMHSDSVSNCLVGMEWNEGSMVHVQHAIKLNVQVQPTTHHHIISIHLSLRAIAT